jgi:hypothetical protein
LTLFHVEVEAELPAHAHDDIWRVLGTDQTVQVVAAGLATLKQYGEKAALAWIVDVKLRWSGRLSLLFGGGRFSFRRSYTAAPIRRRSSP